MILERVIFNILAFTLFLVIFLKMIKRNDTNYTYVLVAQTVGIAIGFIGLIFRINLPIIIILITYLISVLLPLTFQTLPLSEEAKRNPQGRSQVKLSVKRIQH